MWSVYIEHLLCARYYDRGWGINEDGGYASRGLQFGLGGQIGKLITEGFLLNRALSDMKASREAGSCPIVHELW